MRKKPDNHCLCGKKIKRVSKTCVQCRTFPNRQTGRDPVKVQYWRDLTVERKRALRKSVIELLGAKCVRCGFEDPRALQVDHINGGGAKDRAKDPVTFNKKVMQSFLNKENKYQLLCSNCNWIKRYENKEHFGRPRKY